MRYPLILSAVALSLLAPVAAQADDWRDHRGDRHDRYDRYDRRDHWRRDRSPNWSFNYIVSTPRPVYYYPAPATTYYYTPMAYSSAPAAPQRYCREYTGPIRVGGHVEQGYGTACLQPDGSWQMID